MALLYSIRTICEKLTRRYNPFFKGGGNNSQADCQDVMHSAALLQISEFRFFQIAHVRWFGRSITDSDMESIFISYLFNSFVPFWVRHMAREVRHLDAQGLLDPDEFNIKHRQITPEMRAQGEWYIIVVFIILVLFCVLIASYIPSF